jgi:hypothetical protein
VCVYDAGHQGCGQVDPEMRMENLMKSGARTAIGLFGGAVVLVLAVACGGGGGKPASDPTTTDTTNPASSVSSTPPPSPTKGGCIGGLNC